jgi:hypothetical protein
MFIYQLDTTNGLVRDTFTILIKTVLIMTSPITLINAALLYNGFYL